MPQTLSLYPGLCMVRALIAPSLLQIGPEPQQVTWVVSTMIICDVSMTVSDYE